MKDAIKIIQGDCRTVLRELEPESVQCCVTSPPYWGLRDYNHPDQIGQEKTPEEYVKTIVDVMAEVRRVLRNDGCIWLNLGDSYFGAGYSNNKKTGGATRLDGGKQKHTTTVHDVLKSKDLIGIPWRVALALQADGWYLRSDIIWAKPNAMPESVTDRPTRSHEYIFLLTKSARYYYDAEAIKEPCIYNDPREVDGFGHKSVNGKHAGGKQTANGRLTDRQRGHGRRHQGFNDRWDGMERQEQCSGMRNKRDVWTVAPANYPGSHFATFPPALISPCILAGAPFGGVVLDPFGGSGTTGKVALELGRKAILVELNPEYVKLINVRTDVQTGFDLSK